MSICCCVKKIDENFHKILHNISLVDITIMCALELDIETLNATFNKLNVDEKYFDDIFWTKMELYDMTKYENMIKHLLLEYGTKLPCNRFDVGNTIEFIICDALREMAFEVEELPNAKRFDCCVNKKYMLSFKYSSVGDITLHNSNSCINKDIAFVDLLLITPTRIYLLTRQNLRQHGVCIATYLQNTGDSLKLKRKLLTHLDQTNFKYSKEFDVKIDKKSCKNKLCSKLFYDMFMKEYYSSE